MGDRSISERTRSENNTNKRKFYSKGKLVLCPVCGSFWTYSGDKQLDQYISCTNCKKASKLGYIVLQKVKK